MLITHDPFGELREQQGEQIKNKTKFTKSHGTIKKLQRDMVQEAENSKDLAKNLQSKVVSSKNKIDKLKKRQEELKASNQTSSAEYISNYAELIKLNAKVQSQIQRKNQQQTFISKYGTRAATMQKLDHKLIIIGAQMDVKIAAFDDTIDILENDYNFAKKAREATSSKSPSKAKDAAKFKILFTEGWEVEYALDVITSTIAEQNSITASNLNDIDNLTSLYSLDDDELYAKLDELVLNIETGKDEISEPSKYLSPDYKPTHEDNLNSGGFGDLV